MCHICASWNVYIIPVLEIPFPFECPMLFAPVYMQVFMTRGSFCGSSFWLFSTIFCTSLKDYLSFLYISIVWWMKMFVSDKKKNGMYILLHWRTIKSGPLIAQIQKIINTQQNKEKKNLGRTSEQKAQNEIHMGSMLQHIPEANNGW